LLAFSCNPAKVARPGERIACARILYHDGAAQYVMQNGIWNENTSPVQLKGLEIGLETEPEMELHQIHILAIWTDYSLLSALCQRLSAWVPGRSALMA
jgi:hypothetical protein